MKAGPGPAQRQPRRGRVSGQAPGEVGDEVLIGPVGRAGAEHEPAARAAGQLPGAAGVSRGDRHHPRGRPADMDHHLAAVPDDVIAAQRHQLAGPQPRADAEHHHRQRRGRVSPGRAGAAATAASSARSPGEYGAGALAPANGVARCPGGPCAASASRYSADRYVPRVEAPGPPGRPRRTPRSRHSPAGTPRWPGSRANQRTGTARAARGAVTPACRQHAQARARRIVPASPGHN